MLYRHKLDTSISTVQPLLLEGVHIRPYILGGSWKQHHSNTFRQLLDLFTQFNQIKGFFWALVQLQTSKGVITTYSMLKRVNPLFNGALNFPVARVSSQHLHFIRCCWAFMWMLDTEYVSPLSLFTYCCHIIDKSVKHYIYTMCFCFDSSTWTVSLFMHQARFCWYDLQSLAILLEKWAAALVFHGATSLCLWAGMCLQVQPGHLTLCV